MLKLRITQSAESENRYRVEVALEGDNQPRQTATASFDFQMAEQDQENLRWYLEDYLQYPHDPAPTIAARIEEHIAEVGAQLFKDVFQSSEDARDLWATLREHLNETNIEVITSVQEATSIPWELLRDPKTDTPLALRARSFVRAHSQAAQRPYLPTSPARAKGSETETEAIRILLVICRPDAEADVPFRSVASRLIKGLSADARARFQLDVLRPPTFEQLSRVLRTAKADGRPYHVVHFDGHGMYAEVADTQSAAEWLKKLVPLMLSGPRTGKHGFLIFESPKTEKNVQLVDGPTLGKLLVETHVSVLVLNACRSAHAEAPTQPEQTEQSATPTATDPHAQVRALGSLAQEVMDAGVAGVVAMRYNVYVVTAAQFVADLYATLTRGYTLGEAVTLGRKQLAAAPLREIAYDPIPLQDWPVPVVYEAAPITLFPKLEQEARLKIELRAGQSAAEAGALDTDLPKPPDAGFFGRDETLLAMDRAFDTQSVVLLHAYAGSGKTSVAAEFARWYALTGGVQGPTLFTSFEQYRPLARVLDKFGQVFGPMLEQQAGINWLAKDDAERREIALQVMRQIPVLWIWDNVEPVMGFPRGTQSAWSEAEQRELADFLRDARQTQAKFLLTSRRDERAWLGDLPRRIAVPPMPMQERVQLARALAEKHGHRLTDVNDWRPLLRFTGGNPLTITVLVGQALRDGLRTREQIEAFVSRLRRGEAVFEDEASEGRSRSLGAALAYGFADAFNEQERRQLALLHLFQGFVDVDVLRTMGYPDADWCVPEVRGLTREAGIALLDRAAEVGLLSAYGNGYYAIHPALPWFFKSLFDQYFPAATSDNGQSAMPNPQLNAVRAFVEAMGWLGDYYHNKYGQGNRGVIAALSAEEANLLCARELARTHGWWSILISAMQGLQSLYHHTGRRTEWARLVNEIVPDFADPATDGPLQGREESWSLMTEYRVLLFREKRQLLEAEHLQRTRVNWNRQRAVLALDASAEVLDDAQRNQIRTLASSLHTLGQLQRELGQPECIAAYQESLVLSERIGERAGAAACAHNLGVSYETIPAVRDFGQAEHWYRRSLELHHEGDGQGRGGCLAQLGSVARNRFLEGQTTNESEAELLRHFNAALQYYHQALDLLPQNAVDDVAMVNNQLGILYGDAGDYDRAMLHYREAIRLKEASGNLYTAANTRRNVAIDLANAGRLPDALEYANAALRNFVTYGEAAAEMIQQTQELIAEIKQAMQAPGA